MIRRLLLRAWGCLPYVAVILVLCASATFAAFALRNLALQLALFMAAACLPALLTRKMSFVDAAWPWGLVAIGVQVLWTGEGWEPRVWLAGAMYLAAGLRMGLPALQMYRPGLLKADFPRYQYRRLRWRQDGFRSETLSIQYEILLQALMNCSLLALPALLLAFDTRPSFSVVELAAAALWALGIGAETLADRQKARFMREARARGEKRRNCDAGLWRYSRHPNYFAEWMVWNALVLLSLPSLPALRAVEAPAVWWALALALLAVPLLMYHVLVHFTGAVPAEHYSAQKRPDYAAYQRTTNRFFPGPRRRVEAPGIAPGEPAGRRDLAPLGPRSKTGSSAVGR